MTDRLTKLGYLAGASRFRRISEKLQQDGDKIYRENGVSFKASWFSVYYVLCTSNSPQSIVEIAKQIGFSHITVKNVLRELKMEGLVIIKPNPLDKRSKLASLSHNGKLIFKKMEPLWLSFSKVLEEVFNSGHPDLMNILNRIDSEISKNPIHERIPNLPPKTIAIIDYRPSLKKSFKKLAGPWLLRVLDGNLEAEDAYTLNQPDNAYLKKGGFLFYAQYQTKIVGCVALKRLDDDTFEFAKLFIDPEYRNLGIATKLIERCIGRCKENLAKQLWLQTTMRMPQAHKLYYKLGFVDKKAPKQMEVLKRTEKIMCLPL
ncbi:bifunctional helix-turn-helix transcriptional regulator/GNAT family N-acetyltransferase [Ulvibacterium sp.]|uniref:bifunctional helix-turn-helix transcriptional regulator/GNAT family N-acetyltransferase n=1 Tax=Ulvibacterium sp. TaxID=2665914 RepID=UPI0026363FAD|nr:bifunctional helix-turn-helix transcriptional regulator/GNAT family N-acetyltransferase [Ulvibacterium sp.]